MEQDQLNNDVVEKVRVAFRKLNALANKIEEKKTANKLDSWMCKNLEAVENNISKYVTNVKKIVCSTATSRKKFFGKSVKKVYLLQYQNSDISDERLFNELEYLLIRFEEVHKKIEESIEDYNEKYPDGYISNSDASTLQREESTKSDLSESSNESHSIFSDSSQNDNQVQNNAPEPVVWLNRCHDYPFQDPNQNVEVEESKSEESNEEEIKLMDFEENKSSQDLSEIVDDLKKKLITNFIVANQEKYELLKHIVYFIVHLKENHIYSEASGTSGFQQLNETYDIEMENFKQELLRYSQNSLNEAERQRINEEVISQILDHQISKIEGEYKSFFEALKLESMQSDQEARNAISNREEIIAKHMMNRGDVFGLILLKTVSQMFSMISKIIFPMHQVSHEQYKMMFTC